MGRQRARGGHRRCGGGEKGGFTKAFTAELTEEVEALLGAGAVDGLDFEAIETAARRRGLELAARAVERCLNADTSDHAGPTLRCDCGKVARYAGRHEKTFQSALGPLRLERAYYHCDACQAGLCPRDRALGLENSSLSPAVTRMVGLVGAMVSFVEGSELMRGLAGVTIDPKQVERTAEALGREIAADERELPHAAEASTRPAAVSCSVTPHPGSGTSPTNSDLAEQWAKQRRDDLDQGKLHKVLAALRLHAGCNEEARKCLDYVIRNRRRMRYPTFRAQGLCTSTGVVEAGCKTAIGTRCKRAGVHWTVAGADAIIALRCCKLSSRFEDFWPRRSAAATGTTG